MPTKKAHIIQTQYPLEIKSYDIKSYIIFALHENLLSDNQYKLEKCVLFLIFPSLYNSVAIVRLES